jgi:TatD DNase family protein
VPLRGHPNEPANVVHVAACLARARGAVLDELAALTRANAERLFGPVAS